MNDVTMRRILQLERDVASLLEEVQRLRAANRSGLSQSFVQIVQPLADIAGRSASGGGYTITYKRAKLWDISIDESTPTGGTWDMNPVLADSVPRYVLLGNQFEEVITADHFITAAPYKGVYLPLTEECPVE